MRLWAVAVNTFKETIRNHVVVNILIFAIGLILLSMILGDWSLGEQVKIINDFGLAAMSIFGLLMALFIGIRLMVQELEQRTIYIIASKPIHRWEIIWGKYLGLAMMLACNLILMTGALILANLVMGSPIHLMMLYAIILIFVEILIIVGFAILFSSFTSPTLASIFTLIVFILGHMSGYLHDYVRLYPDKGLHWLLETLYYVLPNLENLNLKMAAVNPAVQPPASFLVNLGYGFAYIGILLLITTNVFNRKDFK